MNDSQDSVPQDVFNMPSSPSSDITDDDDPNAVNDAADVDADLSEGSEFSDVDAVISEGSEVVDSGDAVVSEGSEVVDSGGELELGFQLLKCLQEMGVFKCLEVTLRDVLSEFRDSRFTLRDRIVSHLGKLLAKKSKLSEVDLGMDSSEGSVEVQSQKGEDGMGNCKGNLASEADKASDCSDEVLETVVGNLSLSESEVKKLIDDVLIHGFLKLIEICNEEEKNYDWLEVAEAFGITFPRPRWWPEGYDGRL
ncbi:hypothetical protein DEO72_LG2g3410 [Vigna unguiculata]|uniref:Uncharacterized protein n=1 Tax=Vigna unguiculata TaxID=3917 RepID=A0A4D6L3F8_VIGUN|nr:hypothetical protein DEO72_LG2g3410 [Vigna unguiculata]